MSKKKERVILITGAMSDIGKEVAKTFANAGYCVVLNYRNHSELAVAFANTLEKVHGASQAIAIRADIRNRIEVCTLFDEIYKTFSRLDTLVNNAGINQDNSFMDMSDDEWDTVISTILAGTFMCSQEFARRYDGDGGNIINIGSVSAIRGRKDGVNYCSARAGVLAMTKCMALELAPRIRVNAVTPGCIDTEELRTRYQLNEAENLSKMVERIPMERLGDAKEIAGMIFYIATSGSYLTGQNYFVDGGLLMR